MFIKIYAGGLIKLTSHSAQGQSSSIVKDALDKVNSSVHPSVVYNTLTIHEDVTIEKDVTINRDVEIGKGSKIHEGVTIGNKVTIGTGCVIQNGVTIGDNVTICNNVRINQFSVINDKAKIYSEVFLKEKSVVKEKEAVYNTRINLRNRGDRKGWSTFIFRQDISELASSLKARNISIKDAYIAPDTYIDNGVEIDGSYIGDSVRIIGSGSKVKDSTIAEGVLVINVAFNEAMVQPNRIITGNDPLLDVTYAMTKEEHLDHMKTLLKLK